MKKIIAMLFVVLLLFSIMSVAFYAKEDNGEQSRFKINEGKIKDKIDSAKDRFKETKERFLVKKNEFKSELNELKQNCKNNSDNCSLLKDQVANRSKDYLLGMTNNFIGLLEKRKATLEALNNSENEETITKLDNSIEELNKIKNKIEGLDADGVITRKEVKDVAKELRETWKEANKVLTQSVVKTFSNKIGSVLEKTRSLEAKLNRTIEKYRTEGKNVTAISEDIEAFNQYVAEAGRLNDLAKAKFDEARSSNDSSAQLMKEGKEYLLQAYEQLKQAHVKLKEIVKTLKEEYSDNLEEPEDVNNTED